jgi:hypothetical protein
VARRSTQEIWRVRSANRTARKILFGIESRDWGIPATVDFDWTKEAVAKVQDALAEAERD